MWFRRLLAAVLLLVAGPAALAESTRWQSLVGFWWKPSESGWGLTIQQQGTSTFAVWFTYDERGAATWYTLECTFAGDACAGDLYTATGTPFWQVTGSAHAVLAKVGTGAIAVTAPDRLSWSYSVGGVTQTKDDLVPQDFGGPGQVPFCSLEPLGAGESRAGLANYTDHWWGGPDASGWGLQVSHQGHQVFAGWYSYDEQGTASWRVAIGAQEGPDGGHFTGTLYAVTPGIPFPAIDGPVPQSSVIATGTFELRFSDGERGTFTWSLPVPGQGTVVRTLALERFAIAGGAVNACTTARPDEISGRVVASQDRTTPVAGARIVALHGQALLAVTDAAGRFRIATPGVPGGPPIEVTISADGHLTRQTGLQAGTHGVVADIIALAPPFSLPYYRRLVRPVSEGTDAKPGFGLTGWRSDTMNVYIRTNLVDPTDRTRAPVDTGVAVSQVAIDRVMSGLQRTIAEIARGTVKVGRVETGPGAAHEGEPGWMALDFFDAARHPQPDYIGFAGAGTNGSAFARLGHDVPPPAPGPTGVPVADCRPLHQGLAMHELGHVFGLLHAEIDVPNVMLRAGLDAPCADVHFSPAERLHGRIAFSRPRGNEDPDRDPAGYVLPGFRR